MITAILESTQEWAGSYSRMLRTQCVIALLSVGGGWGVLIWLLELCGEDMARRSWLPHDQWSMLKAKFFSSLPFLSRGFRVVCLIPASTVISLNSGACFTPSFRIHLGHKHILVFILRSHGVLMHALPHFLFWFSFFFFFSHSFLLDWYLTALSRLWLWMDCFLVPLTSVLCSSQRGWWWWVLLSNHLLSIYSVCHPHGDELTHTVHLLSSDDNSHLSHCSMNCQPQPLVRLPGSRCDFIGTTGDE